MVKRSLFVAFWVATVVVAVFVGMSLRGSPPSRAAWRPGTQALELRRQVADLEWELKRVRAERGRGPLSEGTDGTASPERGETRNRREGSRRPRRTARAAPAPELAKLKRLAEELLSLEVTDGQGGTTILHALWASDLKFQSELAQYGVRHDQKEVFALGELLLAAASEDPSWLDGLSPEKVSAFIDALLDYVQVRAPGTKARVAERVAAIPPNLESLSPQARETILGWRTEAAETEVAALAKLREEGLPPGDVVRLVRSLSPTTARSLDLGNLLKPAVLNGDYSALGTLRHVETGEQVATDLDPAFFAALKEGRYGPGAVWRYLLGTGRAKWPSNQRFVERGLELEGKPGPTFVYGLTLLQDPLPRDFVLWATEHAAFPQDVRAALRKQFPID